MKSSVSLKQSVAILDVTNIAETIEWYESIGFNVLQTNEKFCPGQEVNWAYLKRDDAAIMLNSNDQSNHSGQSVTLYMHTDNVDDLYTELKEKVKIEEELQDRFYGLRDFYFEDINGFKFGIGQPICSQE